MTTLSFLKVHMPNRYCSLKLVLATFLVTVIFSPVALACTKPNQYGKDVSSPANTNRKLKLVDQTIVDNTHQSTLRQKFLIINTARLTEDEVRNMLMGLFENAKNTCRSNPLQGAMIFLYLSTDTVDGGDWVGRLDTESMSPKIDVTTQLLPRSAKTVAAASLRCESPGAGNTGKKSLNFDNDVILPPIKDRKIIGTWSYQNQCTLSFEEVKGITYEVLRCSDCSGGKKGQEITKKTEAIFQRTPERNGEYFKILSNGNLGSFDRDGVIETYIKHTGRWP